MSVSFGSFFIYILIVSAAVRGVFEAAVYMGHSEMYGYIAGGVVLVVGVLVPPIMESRS